MDSCERSAFSWEKLRVNEEERMEMCKARVQGAGSRQLSTVSSCTAHWPWQVLATRGWCVLVPGGGRCGVHLKPGLFGSWNHGDPNLENRLPNRPGLRFRQVPRAELNRYSSKILGEASGFNLVISY